MTFSLLFDLDGTLVNTDLLHFNAFKTVFAANGVSITYDDYTTSIMGATNSSIMRAFFPALSPTQQSEISARKEQTFRASVKDLTPTQGTLQLLDWAMAHNCGTAVVTNAPRQNAELMLKGIGLLDRIPTLIIADELARGKPDPLPYLTGLERLNGTASRALAFEDSLSGIRAAVAAGIQTFGIRTALPDETLLKAGASHVISDFTDPQLWQILNTLNLKNTTAA